MVLNDTFIMGMYIHQVRVTGHSFVQKYGKFFHNDVEHPTELAMWQAGLNKPGSTLLKQLQEHPCFTHRLLVRRIEMLQYYTTSELNALVTREQLKHLEMFDHILDALDAKVVSKGELKSRKQAYTAMVAYSHVITNVRFGGSSGDRVRLDVSFLGSPFDAEAFDVRIKVAARNNSELVKAHLGARAAVDHLRDLGYKIEDVTAGMDITPAM